MGCVTRYAGVKENLYKFKNSINRDASGDNRHSEQLSNELGLSEAHGNMPPQDAARHAR